METDECPRPPHSITEEREKKKSQSYERQGGYIPAQDDSVSAGTAPLSLTEEVHQTQDGCCGRQLPRGPAAQLQQNHRSLDTSPPPFSLLHLQPPLCDVSMETLLLYSHLYLPIHLLLLSIPSSTRPETLTALLSTLRMNTPTERKREREREKELATCPFSCLWQSMTIQLQLFSQIILHKSPTVPSRGPCVAM